MILAASFYLLRLVTALALPVVLGWLLTRLLAGRILVLYALEQAAISWVLGWGLVTLEMLALGLSGLERPWRPLPLILVWAVTAIPLLLANRVLVPGRRTRRGDFAALAQAAGPTNRWGILLPVGLCLIALQCAAVALHALAWPMHDLDAWSIWAFKARVFFVSQGIPAAYLHDTSKLVSHPDYPLLLPLAETWVYGWLGKDDDWSSMVLFPLFFGSVLALVAGLLRRLCGHGGAVAGSVALACIPYFVTRGSAGDADIPLMLMVAGSLTFLWLWLQGAGPRALVVCGLFGGLGVWTKKEGLILLALAALVVGLASWRRATVSPEGHRAPGSPSGVALPVRHVVVDVGLFLVSALSVAGPWLLVLGLQRPLTRDFLPFTPLTLVTHLDRVPTIVGFVGLRFLDLSRWNVVWIGLAAAVVLRRRYLRGPLAYLLLLLVLQIASDGAVFIFSDWQPYTLHLQTAFDRLLLHSLPLAVVLLVALVAVEKQPISLGEQATPLTG